MRARIDIPEEKREERPLSVIGKIKIGEKRTSPKNGKEYPVSLDYFKATGKYEKEFYNAFPDKTSSITIVFVSDDVNFSCSELYEYRDNKSGKLWGRSNGIDFEWYDFNAGTYVPVEREFAVLESKKVFGEWKATMKIRFLIPEIKGLLGVWELETKGKASSIKEIKNSFDTVQKMAGTVVNIPFELQVERVKSQAPVKEGEYAKQFSVVKLIPHINQDNMLKVSGFIESGIMPSKIGMITEEKILQIESKKTEL